MKRIPLFPDASDEPVQTLLNLATRQRAALRAGSVRLSPNQRVPIEGFSSHAADELSLIVSGSLSGESGGIAFDVAAGEVTLIPAREEHWATAGSEGVEIFWCWFGAMDE